MNKDEKLTGIEALNQLAEEIMYTHNDGKTLTDYDSVRYDAIANDLKRLEKYDEMFNQKQPDDMKFVDRDAKAALFSLHCLSLKEKGVHKDYYWLARKLDEIISKELDKPQELYNLIKEKVDNAKNSLLYCGDNKKATTYKILGQIDAYNDILTLMESMFKVKTHE